MQYVEDLEESDDDMEDLGTRWAPGTFASDDSDGDGDESDAASTDHDDDAGDGADVDAASTGVDADADGAGPSGQRHDRRSARAGGAVSARGVDAGDGYVATGAKRGKRAVKVATGGAAKRKRQSGDRGKEIEWEEERELELPPAVRQHV